MNRADIDLKSIHDYATSVVEGEPLNPGDAKSLILSILKDGNVAFSRHALDELKKDAMTTVDAVTVLRGGVVRPGELVNGTWRYRVQTGRMTVVVAFRSKKELAVVTAWRGTQ